MAPAIFSSVITHLSSRTPDAAALGPLAARAVLTARDGGKEPDPERGILHAGDINNNALFALFGIIGAAFVCLGIWFFFWARNGGFYFKENDWDDYKSTVLRRKGPNGTILSGATPSTQLGGGSVYKDVDDGSTEADNTTVVTATTDSTGLTGITGGVSDFAGREKRRRKREQKEREKERRREDKAREKAERKNREKTGRHVNEEGVLVDEHAEAEAKSHLRKYRHEKPARVGGINKEAEGSAWDGSTNPTHSTASATESTVTSDLMSNRERTPTSTPTKKSAGAGGIRKVYSSADRTAEREGERIRAEARRLQEKGRASKKAGTASNSAAGAAASGGGARRDFSWQRADDSAGLGRVEERPYSRGGTTVPGSWAESDVGVDRPDTSHGTKSYRCVIPGLSSSSAVESATASEAGSTAVSDFAYQDEKRKKRGGAGYRRNRNGME
ncbi:uncharacterized protein E0L32_009801 [Thyridium curvatum]|uniref:Uncharacterized protein n=1 Tax=Thyridium curvatum TaxID=1093900 RepID=A0A507AUX5_9PEZI|nr:uncharacterized protein E0L32_009801 [Thyridium curvatum]TPX08739.1 hypothetical protein E0L32_009801 [Thyridium curvatum]